MAVFMEKAASYLAANSWVPDGAQQNDKKHFWV